MIAGLDGAVGERLGGRLGSGSGRLGEDAVYMTGCGMWMDW